MDPTLKWRRWLGAPPRIRGSVGSRSTRRPHAPCLRLGRQPPRVHGLRPGCRLRSCARRSPLAAAARRGATHLALIQVERVEELRSDWRRAVAAVSERRVAEGRALYTERSPAELYRGARSSARERYARPRGPRKFAPANFWGEPASRLGAQRPSTRSGRNCQRTGTSFSRPGITKWVARP